MIRVAIPLLACVALTGCLASEAPPLQPLTDIETATAARGEPRRPLEPLLSREEAEARAEAARRRAAEAGDDRALAAADAVASKESAGLQPLAPSSAEAVAQAGGDVEAADVEDAVPGEDEAQETVAAVEEISDEALLEELEPEEEIVLGVARPVEETAYEPPIQPLQGRSWLDTGKYLLAQSEPRDAEAAFRRSIALEGVSVEGLTGAGIAAHAQGHLQMARSFLIRAKLLAPDNVDVNNALGTTLMGLGDYAGAYQAFRTAFVVSSGSSEVAAFNLERTRIRANRIATAQPLGGGEIAFDLSRTGPSEFLLHDPGTDVEALLPDAPPAQVVSVDTQAALAIENGADPASVLVESESSDALVEEDQAIAAVEEEAAPAGTDEGAAEALIVETTDDAAEEVAEIPDDAASVITEARPIEAAPLAPLPTTDAPAAAGSASRAPRATNEGRSRELPPGILAAIEGAGAATLAPLADTAQAAKGGGAQGPGLRGGVSAAPAQERSPASPDPIAGTANSGDNAIDEPAWPRAGD